MTNDTKVCDHNNVGIFIWTNQKLLLVIRTGSQFGYTLPSGHVDGELTFEDAARRELKAETGFSIINIEKVGEGKKENKCDRKDGSSHFWKLFKVITGGKLIPNENEVKKTAWFSISELKELAEKTLKYNKKEITESEWEQNPGLEPVILEWFQELKII